VELIRQVRGTDAPLLADGFAPVRGGTLRVGDRYHDGIPVHIDSTAALDISD
jgi:hypothetical protein